MVNIDAPEPPSPLAPLTPVGGKAGVATPVPVTPTVARGLATLEQHTKVEFELTIRCFNVLGLTYFHKRS